MPNESNLYRLTRNWQNLERARYEGAGVYGIPKLQPVYSVDSLNWIGFNFARTCPADERPDHAVHFYVDDYQFARIWATPEIYRDMLGSFGAVCTPDFSMYTDFPRAVQIYNCYRNHWLGCYWQDHGLTVIPCILWSDEASLLWCFDGDPKYSVVMVSSVGTQQNAKSRYLFRVGYQEMLHRLKPRQILFYGSVPDFCTGNIVHIQAYQEILKDRIRKKGETTENE